MAFDAFLKLDTVTGESKDSKHPGEMEIYSFSFGPPTAPPSVRQPAVAAAVKQPSTPSAS